MARVLADSELMTNYVSAAPVPAGSYFQVILDEQRRPMVVSISNDPTPKLQLGKSILSQRASELPQTYTITVKHNKGEPSQVLDIGPCLGIRGDSGRILTFAIQQAENLAVCLCVALSTGEKEARLVVTQPFFPTALVGGSMVPLMSGDHRIGKVEKIWMVRCVSSPSPSWYT
jgi:hypothetical protein